MFRPPYPFRVYAAAPKQALVVELKPPKLCGDALGAIASPLPQGGAEHSDRERALHAQCLIEFAPQACLPSTFSSWCAVLSAVMLYYYIESLHSIVIPSVSANLDSSVRQLPRTKTLW